MILFAVIGCASRQPPPGGPEDKTPPEIEFSSPAERAINVPRDTRVRLIFTTPLDRPSFQQSLNITPYVTGRIEYDWDGYDEVTIEFPELLRENTTYTISLSRDLKNRRGNTLPVPFHLTFSTGPNIDTATLAGIVFPAMESREALNAKEIFLFAYNISGRNADTLDLTRSAPDYITQPDDRGVFEFLAMKQGDTYRVVAEQDAFRNRVYDVGVDGYGLPSHDIRLDSTMTRGLHIRMAAAKDTARPQLQDIEVADAHHLRLRFSEGLDTQSLRPEFFRVENASGANNEVLATFLEQREKRGNIITLLLASPLLALSEGFVIPMFDSLQDAAGNFAVDTPARIPFSTPDAIRAVDTLTVKSLMIEDSVMNLSQMQAITIMFTDAVRRDLAESSITLTDSAKRSVAIGYRWLDDATLVVAPRDTLAANVFHTLTVNTAGIRSPSPLVPHRADTIHVRRFETDDRKDNGRLSGTITVTDSVSLSVNARLVVELLSSSGEVVQVKQLPVGKTTYTFDQVPKGKYRVRGFISEDGSLVFFPGTIVPFRFAAPNGDFPGEVDVRLRWSVDKVDFKVE